MQMSHNDPLFVFSPFISVCTIYCVYKPALIWYFITEESDKNTPADSENVQNPLYDIKCIPLISTIFTNFCFWRTQHFIHTFLGQWIK